LIAVINCTMRNIFFWWVAGAIFVTTGIASCTRDTIEFGTVPDNNFTHLAYIDTVGIKFSTVLIDSFVTGSATSFLLGKYKDPYLGIIKATPFFQLTKPAETPDIPSFAVYDSITLIFKPDKYYYGDTSRQQTIYVNELNEPIVLGDANNIYNTTSFAIKPVPLGSKTLRIRPSVDDSVAIRLNDSKGMELFTKLKDKSSDITSDENFKNYFQGISLTTAVNDTTAVFGLKGDSDSSIIIRVSYHTNIPYDESHHIDFPLSVGAYSFNQLLTDRTGTGIVSAGNTSGITEIPVSQTGGYAYSQPGTGVNLKMTFPSLKNILLTENYVKLLKAELIIRPTYLSFDKNKYKLPDPLHLAYTDGTNIVGSQMADSSGSNVMYASPVTDDIYGENNYYRFNITAYISQLLEMPGGYGLYLMQDFSATSPQVSRLVVGIPAHNNYISRLQLTVLIVNK
jgi:hypothetical protein